LEKVKKELPDIKSVNELVDKTLTGEHKDITIVFFQLGYILQINLPNLTVEDILIIVDEEDVEDALEEIKKQAEKIVLYKKLIQELLSHCT